jgi:hypothetical protein
VVQGSLLFVWLFLELVADGAGGAQGSEDDGELECVVDRAGSAETQSRPEEGGGAGVRRLVLQLQL